MFVEEGKERKVTYHSPLSVKQSIIADPASGSDGKSRAGVKLGAVCEIGRSAKRTLDGLMVVVLVSSTTALTRELLIAGCASRWEELKGLPSSLNPERMVPGWAEAEVRNMLLMIFSIGQSYSD